MPIKHLDPPIPVSQPFLNCKLGREKNAIVLTSIVENYREGFVLAINSPWGTGKTTFLKMWQQHLINKQFKTLYFNAWENDFESNPLSALMGEMKSLVSKNTKSRNTFNSLVKKAGLITKNAAPEVLSALVSKFTGIENIGDFVKKITEATSEIVENEIKNYSEKKNSIEGFRNKLIEFIQDLEINKPIVFMIDELDRCRPDYAVKVLENVKHFFDVPKIVFVLSVDKEQLCHAIKGVYGSDSINSKEYLRRFIDIEYHMPEPDARVFCEYLYKYYDFDSFFKLPNRHQHYEFHKDADRYLNTSILLFEKYKSTLRHQDQIFSYARLVLATVGSTSYLFPDVTLFFVLMKYLNDEFYKKVQKKEYTINQFINELNNIFPDYNGDDKITINQLIFLQAKIFYRYSLDFIQGNAIETYTNETTGQKEIPYITKYDKTEEKQAFSSAYFTVEMEGNSYTPGIGTNYILKNINLYDNVIT